MIVHLGHRTAESGYKVLDTYTLSALLRRFGRRRLIIAIVRAKAERKRLMFATPYGQAEMIACRRSYAQHLGYILKGD